MTYFITFACDGRHLHGDESGAVDPHHNLVGSRVLEPDPERQSAERARMKQPPYLPDPAGRKNAIRYVVDEQGEPMPVFLADPV